MGIDPLNAKMTTHQTSRGGLNMTNLLTQDVVPSEPSYRFIPLTQGKFAIVDAADFDWLNQWRWHFHNGYATRRIGTIHVSLHRFILSAPNGTAVDHINRIRLDCRRFNLRLANQQTNCRNRSLSTRNTSGFTGVGWNKKLKKWKADIVVDGKHIHLGFHNLKEDAVVARMGGEKKYFGEHLVNTPAPSAPVELSARTGRSSTGSRHVFRCGNGCGYFVRIGKQYVGWFAKKREAVCARNEAYQLLG
jgi:hypothetical protein